MKSITKRIISTLAICGALILEAGATAIGSLGKALNNIAKVDAANAAPVNTVLWGEDFSGFSKDNVPAASNTNTVVYGGGSLTYSCGNGGGTTKIYAENTGGGTSPELLVAKSNGWFKAAGIPTGDAKEISLTFLSNKTSFSLACSSNLYTVSGSQKSWTLTLKTGETAPSTFDLTLTQTSSSNSRVDNIELKVTKAGGETPTSTYSVNYLANTTDTVTGLPSAETGLSAGSHTLSTAKPTRSGYDFVGWNTDSSAITGITSVTIGSSDVNVYAIWKSSSSGETGKSEGTFSGSVSTSGIWTATGGSTGKDYYKLVKDAYIYNTMPLTDIDCSKTLTITLNMRTVGGTSYKNINVTAYSNAAMTTAISSAQTITATNGATLADATLDFKFNSSVSCDTVYFKFLSGSGSASNGPGVAKLNLEYTKAATKTVSSIAIKTAPSKTTYYEGETFNPAGLVITATYDDKTTADIPYAGNEGDFTFSPSGALTSTDKSITITYKEKNVTQAITVNSDTLNSVTLGGSVSFTGTAWDLSGVTLTGHYTSGDRAITSFTPTTTTAVPTKGGTYDVSVSVSFGGKSDSKNYSVTIAKGLLESDPLTVAEALTIASSHTNTNVTDLYYVVGKLTNESGDNPYNLTYGNFYINDSGTATDAKLTVYGVTETTSAVSKDASGNWNFSNPKDFNNDGKATKGLAKGDKVLLKLRLYAYTNKDSSITLEGDGLFIRKIIKTLSSIAVTTNPTNTQYSGKAFDKTGMVVTATYSDGSTADVTSSVSITPATLVSTTTSVSISYTEGSGTVSTNLSVDVLTLSKITATGYKTDFRAGESFSFGGTVYPWYTHSSGAAESQGAALDSSEYTVSKTGATLERGNDQEVTVSYGGKNLTYEIDVGYAYVTDITMSSTAEVGVGGEVTFSATVAPETADQSVTYAVDTTETTLDPSEYSLIDNKLKIADEITASGKVFVTATTNDVTSSGEHKTTSCQVTVTKAVIAQITEVKVTGSVTQTEQYVGKTFNYAGLTFTPVWSEGDHDEVTITGANIQWPSLTDGMTSITGKYSTGSSTLDVVVSGFAVVDDYLDSITVSGDLTTKTYYSNSEDWNYAGLSVTGVNASGDPATITESGIEYTANKTPTEYLAEGLDKLVVTATYGGKSNTKEITGIVVNEYKLNKIEITSNPSKVEYIIGETFSETGLVVKATYSDGTTDTDFKGYTLDKSVIDMYAAGTYSVKVQASGVTDATFNVKYGVVTPQKGETYYSRASEINVGDVVTFYAPYVEKVLTGISTTSTKYGESGDAALTDGKLVFAQDVSALDLTVCAGYQAGTYSFKNGDKYLRWNSGNSLDMIGTSVEQSTSWTISIDGSTGHASIINCKQDSGSDRVVLWNYANPRFACYKGQTPKDDKAGYGFVDIYLKTEKPEIVAELIKLDVSCAKTFKEGETLYISDLTVNGLYNDGTTSTIETGVTFADGFTSKTLVAGSNTFTVKCGSVEASITVVAGEIKHVTSVTLGNTVDSLIVGQSNTFTATVAPEDATYKDITWSVEGSGATIDQNGKLTATSTGSVTVKATAEADGVAASHTFSIIADSVTSIALNEDSTVKTTYFDGDNFDPTGLKIDVTYASGKEETITYSADCGITFDESPLKSSDNKIVVSYGDQSCDLGVTVEAIVLTSIEASTTKLNPDYGQSFTKDDVTVIAHYNDSRKDHQLASSDFTMSDNYDSHKSGETQELSISYTENGVTKESSVSVTVKDAVVTAIAVKQNPTTTNYIVGQNFDPTGLVITLTYNDGSTVDVAYSDDTKSLFSFDVTTFTSTSQNKVVVTYAGKTADISVSVLTKAVSSISVVTSPKTDYVEGQAFDPTGLVINVIYNDGSNENIEYAGHESQFSFSPSTALSLDNDKVTVTYGGQNASITLNVSEKAITGISVVTSPKTEYIEGQTFDPTGLVINVAYNDGTNENITYAEHEAQFSFSPSTALSLDNDKVTVTFGGKSADINISVVDKSISGISVLTEPKTEYIEGQTFDPTGLEITVTYDNGSSETVKYNEHASAFSFSIDRELEQTDTSITITYSGQTADLGITVVEKTVTDIAIDESSTVKTSYDDGDNFDPTGLVIKVTYDNGKTEKITYSEGCGITFDKTKLVYGDESVVITYQTKTANLPITVAEKYVTSITANKTELELDYNKDISSSDIEVTIHYSNGDIALADFDSLEISGYNKNVPGTYENVEVKLNDVAVQIKVTVKQSTVIDHIEVDPSTKTLEYGEEIGSYKVYAVYSDDAHVEGGHREDITSSVTVSEFDGTPGNHTLTISYNSMECSISYTVKASEVIDHIIVSTDKTNLEFNEEFTTDDVTVKLVYTDGHEAPGQADEIIGYYPNHSGEQIITVVSGDKEATITVTVKELSEEAVVEAVAETIEVAYDTQVDPNDIKVKITFEDGHTEEVGAENLQGFDPTIVGEQEVVVEVGGRSVTLRINVLPSTIVDHIEVSTSKPVVNLGSNFTSSDVSVTCVYTDGHTAPGTVEKIEGFNKDQLGSQELTVTANGHEGKVVIEVTNHFVTSITVESYNEYVDQGKDYVFANENTVVTANYADGTSTKVTDYTVSAVDTSGHGPQKATVSYDGVSAEVTVNVIQTETPVEPYQTTAIIGGAVVGVAIICAGIFFFLKKFKL